MAEKKLITAWGETKTLSGWSEDTRCSVSANTLSCRLNRGWDVEKAVSSPGCKSGSELASSKLTEKDIPEIFRLREEMWTFKELSLHFGVTPADIGYVLHGDIWWRVDHDYKYTPGRVWTDKNGTRRFIAN